MKAPSIRPVRCAIYTRVSTEYGLDQEFNSLDAQYDAASAYIKSQAHAGWTLIRSRYDDGGYSGGSTDRPDLQRLLDDIRSRKLDVIVVYKVDRLTRSLADFAKLTLEHVVRIDVHEDRLAVRLKSADDEETSDAADDYLLSIPWQKPPSRKSRQILIPHGIPKRQIRPTRIERRARLGSAIARGRRWLDEIVSGSVTDVQQIASRQKCSVRQVNMTISLAFLAPELVRAAVEGCLPRGSGVERLRDAPAEWRQQFEALGLNPH